MEGDSSSVQKTPSTVSIDDGDTNELHNAPTEDDDKKKKSDLVQKAVSTVSFEDGDLATVQKEATVTDRAANKKSPAGNRKKRRQPPSRGKNSVNKEPPVVMSLNDSNLDHVDMTRYMDKLLREVRVLNNIETTTGLQLQHIQNLVTMEVERVWDIIYEGRIQNHRSRQRDLSSHVSEPAALQMKIPIPPSKEKCNFIGRILGPCGISVKQLEAETGCTILIRGVGSVKDPRREARLLGKAGWEHLSEPLHVLITASDSSYSRCQSKLKIGADRIRELLTPSFDEYKRRQLIQLAIMNGTYRPAAF